MNYFKNQDEAMLSIESSLNSLEEISHITGRNERKIEPFVDAILGKILNVCEGILYLCCYEDSDPNGRIPFPTLKSLKDTFGPTNIPNNIREATNRMAKAESIDFRKPKSIDDYCRIFEDVFDYLDWIISNSNFEYIKDYSRHLLHVMREIELIGMLGE